MAGEQSLKLSRSGRCNWGANRVEYGGGVSNRVDSLPAGEAEDGERDAAVVSITCGRHL